MRIGTAILGLLAAPWAAAPAEPSRAEVEAVQVAVLRQQVEFWLDDHARESKLVVCLAIEEGGSRRSPSKELLGRLPEDPAVRPLDACEERVKGSVERATGRPALVITVGDLSWRSAHEVWVSTRHYRSGLVSGQRTQRVVREPLGWVCLGQIIKDTPA